ncbi:hypothetical protein FQZ97_742740 [compost metagenome]
MTQAHSSQQAVVLDRQSRENRQRHMLIDTCCKPLIEGQRIFRRAAGHPGDHTRVQSAEGTIRQLVCRQVIDSVAQVLEQPTQMDMPRTLFKGPFSRVVDQGNAAWLDFDRADAQVVEIRHCHERDETFRTQANSELACFATPLGRQVINRDQRHALGAQWLQMPFQPIAVILRYRAIDTTPRIPTGMNRLDRHGGSDPRQLWQDFEATVEEQLQRRLLAFQRLQEVPERDTLSLPLRLWQQLETIQRIEEKPDVAVLAQLGGAAQQMLPPNRRGKLHDLAAPRVVAHLAGTDIQTLRF